MIGITLEKGLSKTSPARIIRQAVFVEEQGFQNEFDTIDELAYHIVLAIDNEPAATGRVFPKKDDPAVYIIGRMAVLPKFRSQRYGSMVIAALEEQGKKLGAKTFSLSAQVQAQGFYEKLGYHAVGDIYGDEGCPHIQMVKEL